MGSERCVLVQAEFPAGEPSQILKFREERAGFCRHDKMALPPAAGQFSLDIDKGESRVSATGEDVRVLKNGAQVSWLCGPPPAFVAL